MEMDWLRASLAAIQPRGEGGGERGEGDEREGVITV